MKQMKPLYEVLLDLDDKHDKIVKNQTDLLQKQTDATEQITMNQSEIMVAQGYANCLLEMGMEG